MRVCASATMSSNVRLSITGSWAESGMGSAPFGDEERIDDIRQRIVGADAVVDAQEQEIGLAGRNLAGHVKDVDPRLLRDERLAKLIDDLAHALGRAWREDEVMDAAAVVRPHHALLLRGREDDPDRLLDLCVVGRCRQRPLRRHGERKGEASASEGARVRRSRGLDQHGSASATSWMTVATSPRSSKSVCMA